MGEITIFSKKISVLLLVGVTAAVGVIAYFVWKHYAKPDADDTKVADAAVETTVEAPKVKQTLYVPGAGQVTVSN